MQSGETALMKASSEGHVQCVKLVLDWGADVNHQDSKVSAESQSIIFYGMFPWSGCVTSGFRDWKQLFNIIAILVICVLSYSYIP